MYRGLPGSSGQTSATGRMCAAGGALLAAGLVVYVLMVGTRSGQRLDLWLLPRSGSWGGYEQQTALLGPARQVLALAGNPVLLAVVLGVVLLGGVLGGRVREAVAAGGVVAVTLGVAGAAKEVLPRADFGVSGSITHNSFPSGHVAVAMAVVVAALLVVPARGRWLVAVPGAAGVCVVAGATMVAGWHRLSDVAGSVALAGAAYCFGAALAGVRGEVAPLGVAGAVGGLGGVAALLVACAVTPGMPGGWPVAVAAASGVVGLVVVLLLALTRPGVVAAGRAGGRVAVGAGLGTGER
ncbi:phosphatase PAP2 family protein [Dactylosporangium sucinum]|nr:phosphatase PAP2 family protein [Dactylosporangium sucinum]